MNWGCEKVDKRSFKKVAYQNILDKKGKIGDYNKKISLKKWINQKST